MPHVLIVDDETSIRMALARLLSAHSETSVAAGVREAVALIRTTSFDVIVSDYELPDGTGVEILRSARLYHPQALRVLSSGRTPPNLWALMAEGVVNRWFPKPFEVEALLELVLRRV